MKLRILGPLEIETNDGQILRKPHRKGQMNRPSEATRQVVLVLLAHRPGEVVTTKRILDAAWGTEDLKNPKNAVHKAIGDIRELLRDAGVDDEEPIETLAEGSYRLKPLTNIDIDYSAYLKQLSAAQSEREAGARLAILDEALLAWRGDPPEALKSTAEGLTLWGEISESRVQGEKIRVLALIEERGIAQASDILAKLIVRYPDNEEFLRLRVMALSSGGRQHEAVALVEAYQDRADDQGITPGPALLEAYREAKHPTKTAVARPLPKAFNPEHAMKAYLGRVISASRRLRFGDATREPGDGPDQGSMTLDKVWTPIQVSLPPMQSERLETKTEEISAIEALQDATYSRVVLLANPGGGKSTIVAYRTFALATSALTGEGPHQIPIHVRLALMRPSPEAQIGDIWSGVNEVHLDDDVDEQLTALLTTRLKAGGATLLFDGLDEVQEEFLPRVLQIIDLCALAYEDSPVVATCRTFDYNLDRPRRKLPFPTLQILPFELPQQLDYVSRWYDALSLLDADPASGDRKRRLQKTLEDSPNLVEMGRTPLLLALMTLVHTQDGELPAARAILYRRTIAHLLAETALWRERTAGRTIANQDMLLLAARVGYEYHKAQEVSETEFRGMSERQIEEIVADHFQLYKTNPGTKAREEISERVQDHLLRLIQSNGLLVGQGGGTYDFSFKQYREFLAGLYLGSVIEEDQTLEMATRSHWHECFQLLASHAAGSDTNISYLLHFINELGDSTRDSPPFGSGDVLLAAEMLHEIGRAKLISLNQSRVLSSTSGRGTAGLWGRTTAALLPLIESRGDSLQPTSTRIRAGFALGRLGDTRLVDSESAVRPLTDRVVRFQAGTAQVGINYPASTGRRKLDSASVSPRRIEFQEFSIGRYPVTNIEFQEFIDAGGYNDERWWPTFEANSWRSGDGSFIKELESLWMATSKENYSGELRDGIYNLEDLERTAIELCRSRDRPFFLSNGRFNAPNQPVVGVNFWEARAFCLWLTEHGHAVGWLAADLQVRLPSEWEWERATRLDGDGHAFPWGDNWTDDAARTRHDGTGLNHPSPVGAFPEGIWPGGPLDMAGNVWEWTAGRLVSYDRDYDKNRDDPAGLSERAIRGSSWYDANAKHQTLCSSRYLDLPGNIYFDLGFRAVVAAVPEGQNPRKNLGTGQEDGLDSVQQTTSLTRRMT